MSKPFADALSLATATCAYEASSSRYQYPERLPQGPEPRSDSHGASSGRSAGHPCISIITYYELLRGLKELSNPRKLADFDDLIRRLSVRLLTQRVMWIAAELYVELRRRGEPLEDADILIAATARAHDLVLVTDNEAHFQRIQGLGLENWLREL